MRYILLILSLPTENATLRQRVWRALKTSGAAELRDGVYLLPATEHAQAFFRTVATDIRDGGGTSHLMMVAGEDAADYPSLFDRSREYGLLLEEIAAWESALSVDRLAENIRQVRKLRKSFGKLAAIDFFPGPARQQAESALQSLERASIRIGSPDEPEATQVSIPLLEREKFQQRLLATRRRPWVDRLASAWLILRCIDPAASFFWLEKTTDLPEGAIGFDFDGAAFTHVGQRVTFEVLLESFALNQPAFVRMGRLIHFLDVGGIEPPEATGVETVLGGLRSSVADDDALLSASLPIFDGLLAQYSRQKEP